MLEIIFAIRLRKEKEGEWLQLVAGILSVLFGLVIFIEPVLTALASIWAVGVWAIIIGLLLIVQTFRVKDWGDGGPTGMAPA